jgi:hypothetical protein
VIARALGANFLQQTVGEWILRRVRQTGQRQRGRSSSVYPIMV